MDFSLVAIHSSVLVSAQKYTKNERSSNQPQEALGYTRTARLPLRLGGMKSQRMVLNVDTVARIVGLYAAHGGDWPAILAAAVPQRHVQQAGTARGSVSPSTSPPPSVAAAAAEEEAEEEAAKQDNTEVENKAEEDVDTTAPHGAGAGPTT